MLKHVASMTVGQMTDPAAALLPHPAGDCGFALVGNASQDHVNALLRDDRHMLLVRDKEGLDASGHGMIAVDDLNSESL